MVKKTKRISINLLDDELRSLIETRTKIFPVQYEYILENTNPYQYEYVRVVDNQEHKHEIYIWDNGFTLIGADDYEVTWEDIKDKPSSFRPEPHKHTEMEVIGLDKFTQAETLNLLTQKADIIHSHEDYVLKQDNKSLTSNDFTDELKNKLDTLSDNASVDYSDMEQALAEHEVNVDIHVTAYDKSKINLVDSKADTSYVNNELSKKVNISTFNGHTGNTNIHVTQNDKDYWNSNTDKHYVFIQEIPNTTWTILHNLNKYPNISVFDYHGDIILCRYEHIDMNTIKVYLNNEDKGKVILN